MPITDPQAVDFGFLVAFASGAKNPKTVAPTLVARNYDLRLHSEEWSESQRHRSFGGLPFPSPNPAFSTACGATSIATPHTRDWPWSKQILQPAFTAIFLSFNIIYIWFID
jgi:hypothetical protein